VPAGDQDEEQQQRQKAVKDQPDYQAVQHIQGFLSGSLLW
jgi:hypothetical protein